MISTKRWYWYVLIMVLGNNIYLSAADQAAHATTKKKKKKKKGGAAKHAVASLPLASKQKVAAAQKLLGKKKKKKKKAQSAARPASAVAPAAILPSQPPTSSTRPPMQSAQAPQRPATSRPPASTARPPAAAQRPPVNQKVIYERVPTQEGAECGYHALFNGWSKYQQLMGLPRPDLTSTLKQWKTAIRKRRHSDDDQWLDDGEVEFLARSITVPVGHYTIISDIMQIRQNPTLLHEDILDAIMRLRAQDNAVHSFILGDMAHHLKGSPGGTQGHWIAVVVHKQAGQYKYYALDSMNWHDHQVVGALVWLLETVEVAKLAQEQKVLASLDRELSTMKQKYALGNWDEVLDVLETIIKQVTQANLLQSRPFLIWKKQLREIIDFIVDGGSPEQQRRAQALLKSIGL